MSFSFSSTYNYPYTTNPSSTSYGLSFTLTSTETVRIYSITLSLGVGASGYEFHNPISQGATQGFGNGGSLSTSVSFNGHTSDTSLAVNNAVVSTTSDDGPYPSPSGNWVSYKFTWDSGPTLSANTATKFTIIGTGNANIMCGNFRNGANIEIKTEPETKPITGSISLELSAASDTVLYGDSVTVSASVTYSGVPSPRSTTYYWQSDSGTTSNTREYTITEGTPATLRQVSVTATGYTGSLTEGPETVYINCKLRTPTISINYPSTGGYTIGNSFSLSSGINVTHNSNGPGGEGSGYLFKGVATSGSVILDDNSYVSACSTKNGYTSSAYSYSETINVFKAPRNMTTNGFTRSFGYGSTTGDSMVSLDSILPHSGYLKVSWSSFSASKNLGRFNHYTIYLVNESTNVRTSVSSGSNNPETAHSVVDIPIASNTTSGISYHLVLECSYIEDDVVSASSSSVFTSSSFTIGSPPNTPTMYYPVPVSTSTANQRLRVIFKLDHPDGSDIEDVKVVVVVGSSTYTYSYSNTTHRSYFFSKKSSKPTAISSGSVVDFTVPQSVIPNTNGTSISVTISASSYGLWSSTVTRSLTFIRLNYMTQGRKLLESDMTALRTNISDITKGYSHYGSTITQSLPSKVGDDYLVQDSPYIQSSGVLNKLTLLYQYVSADSIPPSGAVLDLSRLDITSTGQWVKADDTFGMVSGNPYVQPVGNYFNYIMYILKFML